MTTSLDELEEEYLALLEEELRSEARQDLLTYARLLHLDWDSPPWFHVEMARELAAWVTAPDPYILVLTLPPGHAKSSYVASAVAWAIGRAPKLQGAYVSYSSDKAEEIGTWVVEQIDSPEWRAIFGEYYLPKSAPVTSKRARDTQVKSELVTDAGVKTGGSITLTGWQGGLTGGRYDFAILDDLIKDQAEVRSPRFREDQWQWLYRVVLTRNKFKSPTRVCIVQTRWHLDDLAGRVLKRVRDVRHVHFEAVRARVHHPADPRAVGDALWPELLPISKLEEMRRNDPAGFACLMQGDPVAEGGDIVKEEWIAFYDELPSGLGTWLQSWDTKHGSTEPTSAECVGQLWFVPDSSPGVVYWVDEVAGIWDTSETLERFELIQSQDLWSRASVILMEKKGDGVTVISLFRHRFPGLIEVQPRGSKEDRLRRVSNFFRAANVRYPLRVPEQRRAEQLAAHLGQITTFSVSALKDRGDAASQLLEHLFLSDRGESAEERAEYEEQLLKELL